MQEELLQSMFDSQERHWWFTTKRNIVVDQIDRALDPKTSARVLDVGCGSGSVSIEAALQVQQSGKVFAIDLDPNAIELTKKNIAKFYILILKRFFLNKKKLQKLSSNNNFKNVKENFKKYWPNCPLDIFYITETKSIPNIDSNLKKISVIKKKAIAQSKQDKINRLVSGRSTVKLRLNV